MASLKFGNTSFDVNRLAFRNKSEFLKIYGNKLTSKELNEAWSELKKHTKEEPKHKKKERE